MRPYLVINFTAPRPVGRSLAGMFGPYDGQETKSCIISLDSGNLMTLKGPDIE